MDIRRLLFAYDGRIGRMTYLWASFALLILQIAGLALLIKRGVGLEHLLAPRGVVFLALFVLLFGWMHGALATKRFHDLGRSGWMTAIMFGGMGIPVIDFYCMWLFGLLLFRAGDTWANAYGPPIGGFAPSGGLGGDSGEAYQARAFAAIDELARSAAKGGAAAVPSVAPALASPVRTLPRAAPPRALPPRALPAPAAAGFGRRNAGSSPR